MSVGRPRKYEGGMARISLNVPITITKNLEEYADAHQLSRTDVLISALNLLTTPELNETLKYKAEAAKKRKKVKDLKLRLAPFLNKKDEMDEYQFTKFKFQVMKEMRVFDKTLFQSHEAAERSANLFHSYLLKGEARLPVDVVGALKLRLDFLYNFIFPDLFIFYEEAFTSDGEAETVKNTSPIWYTFKAWADNGMQRPKRPASHPINPLRRQDYILGAKQTGRRELVEALPPPKGEEPPKLIHDELFDNLMDDAEELEKTMKKPKPEASP